MASYLLVHPPLLGPAVWGPCAAVLAAHGHRVTVPDLRPAVEHPDHWWTTATDLAAQALAGRPAGGVVVVGHSGAGVVLPLVARRVGAAAVVFVDALVPAAGGAAPSGRFREFLAGLPVEDGRLPPWSSWWGPDVLAGLLPDPDQRARLAADEPRLPLACYDHAVPVPAGWEPAAVGYLRLSGAYRDDAAEAARRGWPVRELDGTHLDLVTRPAEVAALVEDLANP